MGTDLEITVDMIQHWLTLIREICSDFHLHSDALQEGVMTMAMRLENHFVFPMLTERRKPWGDSLASSSHFTHFLDLLILPTSNFLTQFQFYCSQQAHETIKNKPSEKSKSAVV